MNEKLDESEIDKENFEKANMILSFIFSFSNVLIIFLTIFIHSTINKNIKALKTKLCGLIVVDIISLIFNYTYNYSNSLFFELISSTLNSFEFYLFISFIYQIFNTTELSKLAKEIELINPIQLGIIFLLIIFSYYKFAFFYSHLIHYLQIVIILTSLLIFYFYLKKAIINISNNLLSNDFLGKNVYYYLEMLNTLSFSLLSFYNIIKIFLILIHNPLLKIYIGIGLNTINQGLKYFVFILYEIIIYILNKNNNHIRDESVEIFQRKT